jgi:hypothetical protein
MPKPKQPAPAAKRKPPVPPKKDVEERRIDEAEDESFPASDPNSETQPKPTPKKK